MCGELSICAALDCLINLDLERSSTKFFAPLYDKPLRIFRVMSSKIFLHLLAYTTTITYTNNKREEKKNFFKN